MSRKSCIIALSVFLALLVLTIFLGKRALIAQQRPAVWSVAFHVPYGDQRESELGVFWSRGEEGSYDQGPSGIAVDAEGIVYIGDVLHGKIKKYSSNGEFLASSEGKVNRIFSFVVNDTGNLYVKSVVPQTGSSQLTRIKPNDRVSWTYTLEQVVPEEVIQRIKTDNKVEISGVYGRLSPGQENTVLFSLPGFSLEKPKTSFKFSILLDEQGKYKGFFPFHATEALGELWGSEVSYDKELHAQSINVPIYDISGKLQRTIHIDPQNAVEKARYQDIANYISTFSDKGKGVFVYSTHKLATPIQLSAWAFIYSEGRLYRYDYTGNYQETITFQSSPFLGSTDSYTIGPDGTLYSLRFTKSGVDVMKYAVPAEK